MATLITGLGYIGSALARRFLTRGEQVVAIENFFSTPRPFIAALADEGDLGLIEGSVADPDTIKRAFAAAPIETIFHLAAQASAHPDAAPLAYTVATNVIGTQQLLAACASHGVRRVVLASSARLYAPPLPRLLSEASPLHAPDLVHVSQLLGETLLQATRQQHPTWEAITVAARIGTVHGLGPVMKEDPRFLAVPQRYCWQAARGETLRVETGPASLLAFVQLDDVVDGLLHCAGVPLPVHLVNLATEIRSVADVARIVRTLARARGISVKIELNGRPPRVGQREATSALDVTGFQPRKTLEESLGPVLDHYLNPTRARAR